MAIGRDNSRTASTSSEVLERGNSCRAEYLSTSSYLTGGGRENEKLQNMFLEISVHVLCTESGKF